MRPAGGHCSAALHAAAGAAWWEAVGWGQCRSTGPSSCCSSRGSRTDLKIFNVFGLEFFYEAYFLVNALNCF